MSEEWYKNKLEMLRLRCYSSDALWHFENGSYGALRILTLTESNNGHYAPVVLCKECKYYMGSSEKCGLIDTRLRFYETDKTWTKDDFCSWGERKTDETD